MLEHYKCDLFTAVLLKSVHCCVCFMISFDLPLFFSFLFL